VKATHYQIQLTTPKESLRLPSEPDPLEKRNKQLEAELLRYKSRQPILEVQFKDGQNHSRFQIARSSDVDTDSAETIQAMLAKAREKCPLLELRSLQDPEVAANTMNPLAELGETIRKITESFGEFGRRFYEDYNARASAYYRDYEKYLRDTIAFKTLGARTIRLDLVLDNSGTCPAEDVVIVLHFPDGFELWDENNPPKEPQEPKAPSKELNLYPNISFLSTIPDLRLPLPRNRSLPRIRKTNSYEVTFETDKLQHGFIWTLTPLYAVFDSWESAKSFSIDFAIHAGNTIDERTGQLAVVIVKT
jgi:hypothetical protein